MPVGANPEEGKDGQEKRVHDVSCNRLQSAQDVFLLWGKKTQEGLIATASFTWAPFLLTIGLFVPCLLFLPQRKHATEDKADSWRCLQPLVSCVVFPIFLLGHDRRSPVRTNSNRRGFVPPALLDYFRGSFCLHGLQDLVSVVYDSKVHRDCGCKNQHFTRCRKLREHSNLFRFAQSWCVRCAQRTPCKGVGSRSGLVLKSASGLVASWYKEA